MQLYEGSSGRIRLIFPAELREEHALLEAEYLEFSLECNNGEPTVRLTPVDDYKGEALTRAIVVSKNKQVSVSFPRPLAEALQMIDTDVRLESVGRSLLLRPTENK